jgi:hypothetical protein
MADLDKEIRDAQIVLDNLLEKKRQLQKLRPEEQLAIRLHDNLCHWNHTDGCSWFYETKGLGHKHDWAGNSHRGYLEKALYLEKVSKLLRRCVDLNIDPASAISLMKDFKW